MKNFEQFLNESVDEKHLNKYLFNKTYLQEWETLDVKQKNCLNNQMVIFDNLGDKVIKKYKIVIPPSGVESVIKIIFKHGFENMKENITTNEKNMKSINSCFSQVYELLLNNDISTIIHDVIHYKQPDNMCDGFPEIDFMGKPIFSEFKFKSFDKDKIRRIFYMSRPSEIMAYAWTHVTELKNTFTDLVYKELDIIFPGIYNLFMKYVNEYNDIYEKWLLEYKRSIDAKLFFLNEFSSKISKMNKIREYIEDLYPNKEELKDNEFVPKYLKESYDERI